jgi:hypothetical protein
MDIAQHTFLDNYMKDKGVVLKVFLILIICSSIAFVGSWIIIIGSVVINDTISNNKIMEENEKEYRKIIHPKETKSLAFTNEIVAPPSTGHQCWFLLEDLRTIIGYEVNFVDISNKYKALNGEINPEIRSLVSASSYDIHKLEQIWNVSLRDKNIENLYTVSALSSGEEDADLRCL